MQKDVLCLSRGVGLDTFQEYVKTNSYQDLKNTGYFESSKLLWRIYNCFICILKTQLYTNSILCTKRPEQQEPYPQNKITRVKSQGIPEISLGMIWGIQVLGVEENKNAYGWQAKTYSISFLLMDDWKQAVLWLQVIQDWGISKHRTTYVKSRWSYVMIVITFTVMWSWLVGLVTVQGWETKDMFVCV